MSVAVTGTVIAAYLTVSGLLPLYNKALFQLFSFPVSATMLQLAAVSLMLFLRDRLVRLWCRGSQPPAIGASFGTKAKLLLLPAAFFGGRRHYPGSSYWRWQHATPPARLRVFVAPSRCC